MLYDKSTMYICPLLTKLYCINFNGIIMVWKSHNGYILIGCGHSTNPQKTTKRKNQFFPSGSLLFPFWLYNGIVKFEYWEKKSDSENHFPLYLLFPVWLYKRYFQIWILRENQCVYAYHIPQGIHIKNGNANSTTIDQRSYWSICKQDTELQVVFNEMLMHCV